MGGGSSTISAPVTGPVNYVDLLDASGFARDEYVVLDRGGVVRWAVVNGPGEARDPGQYREAVAAIP